MLIGIVLASSKTSFFGLRQFVSDTMDHFGYSSSVFVTEGDLCCCSEMVFVVTRVHLCYEDDNHGTNLQIKIMKTCYLTIL